MLSTLLFIIRRNRAHASTSMWTIAQEDAFNQSLLTQARTSECPHFYFSGGRGAIELTPFIIVSLDSIL